MNIIILVVSVLALVCSSCGGLSFDLSQSLPEQKVAGSPLGGILPSLIPNPIPITVDIKAETEKRNTGPATAVYLKSMSLSATPTQSPSGTFDFLSEVHIYIAPKDGSSSLPKIEIAYIKPVPKGQTKVEFTVLPEVNLLPYINSGTSITASATGSQPAKDFTYVGELVFNVRI